MNANETSPADAQILAILADLQSVIGDDLTKLEPDEIARVRSILAVGDTLVEIAKYEDAKGLIRAKWRGIILGVSALLTALVAFWSNVEKIGGKLAWVFQ